MSIHTSRRVRLDLTLDQAEALADAADFYQRVCRGDLAALTELAAACTLPMGRHNALDSEGREVITPPLL